MLEPLSEQGNLLIELDREFDLLVKTYIFYSDTAFISFTSIINIHINKTKSNLILIDIQNN
jgi:hypothetical protein